MRRPSPQTQQQQQQTSTTHRSNHRQHPYPPHQRQQSLSPNKRQKICPPPTTRSEDIDFEDEDFGGTGLATTAAAVSTVVQEHQQQPTVAPSTLPSLTDFIITEQEEEQLNKAASAALSSLSDNNGVGDDDDDDDEFELFDPEPIQFGGATAEGGGSAPTPAGDEFSSLLLNLSEDQDFVDALLAIGENDDGDGDGNHQRLQQDQQQHHADDRNTKQVDTETNGDNAILLQQLAEGGDNQQDNTQPPEGEQTTDESSSNSLPDIEIDFGSEPFLLDDPTSLNTVFDEDEGVGNNSKVQDVYQRPPESEEEKPANTSTSTTTNLEEGDGVVQGDGRGQEEEEELLRQFVESLVLNSTANEEGNIGASADTTTDFEPDNLLDELAKLNLFEEKLPYLGEMDDILNNGGDMGGTYDNNNSDEGLPPGMYPYCLPCSVQPSQTNNNISAGVDGSSLAENAVRQQPQQQPHQPDQEPVPESFASANTGILTYITEDQPFVQRTQEEAKTELQALYAASRRQYQQQQCNTGTLDESGTESHEEAEDVIQIDHNDPLVQDMKEQMKNVEPEIPGWWEVADQWCTGFGVDLHHEMGLPSAADGGGDKLCGSGSRPGRSTEKACMGHKETIYGVTFSPDGKWLATASQDSAIAIWEVENHRLVTLLQGHSKAYECLRVDWAGFHWSNETLDREGRFRNLIASSGADGIVKVWSSAEPKTKDSWKCEFTLDHAKLLNRGVKNPTSGSDNKKGGDDDEDGDENITPDEDEDKPQVYSLQFVDRWKVFTDEMHESSKILVDDQNSFLMTSSDEYIHLWEIEKHPFDQQLVNSDQQKIRILQDSEIKLKEVMSLHFGSIEQYGYGVTPCSITGDGLQLPPPPLCSKHKKGDDTASADGQEDNPNFGGERNPKNLVYVFDAAYCSASGLLGVALSDGSLRLINGRGTCISILNLPGESSPHLTALAWDCTGSRLATTVATGHVITWGLDIQNEQGGRQESMVATCRSIYEGGHQAMRPVFGARFVGDGGGAENNDSEKEDQGEKLLVSWGVDGRLCLWDSYALGNIYAPIATLKNDPEYPIYAAAVSGRHVAVGGGRDGGFIGTPLYLYDIPSTK